MSLSCGLFRRSSRRDENPRRTRTMSIFGNSNLHSINVMQKMVNLTTFANPAQNGWKKDESNEVGSGNGNAARSAMPDTHMSTDMRDTLERAYNNLRGRKPRLSRKRFANFLEQTQGEKKIRLEKDFYDFGEFLFTWMSGSSDAVGALPEKDLTKPITNYFINSSHNTYLVGNQLASRSSPEAYKTVLSRDCRCIEIDIWNGDAIIPSSRSNTPKADHRRGLSGSSFPNAATTVFDKVEDTYETLHHLLRDKSPGRSRSASGASRPVDEDVSSRSSAQFSKSDPKESQDRLGVSRSPKPRSRPTFPRGEPIVTHGWTLTAPCGFREVCKVIRESAFVDNDLPVMVSLEVHADTEQQEVMVRIMKEEWREMLLDKQLEGYDPRFRLPKLEDLRKKILVKVKKAHAHVIVPPNTMALPAIYAQDEDASGSEDDKTYRISGSTLTDSNSVAPAQSKGVKVPICESLGSLGIYTRSQHYKSLDTREAKLPPHIFSISENRILEMNQKNHRQMFTHNKNYFMRAFPAGRRIDSSNPDPSLFWRGGVQMVAMNWQNFDEGMMLNEGMFADEQGWVLKPSGYQVSDRNAETQSMATPGRTMDLKITVFSGQHIPVQAGDEADKNRSASTIRPLIKAELHVDKLKDAERDGQTHECEYKQKTTAGKTDHPDFGPDGAVLQFLNISKVVEELGFISLRKGLLPDVGPHGTAVHCLGSDKVKQVGKLSASIPMCATMHLVAHPSTRYDGFKIEDDSSKFGSTPLLAWACIRLDRLRSGYRFIKLMGSRGTFVEGGKLLVKIEKTFR